MTTKELLTRLSDYAQLDSSALYFQNEVLDKCYQVCILTSDSRLYYYILNLFLFPSLITGLNVKSVMIDTFSREQFLIQVKYFKAFYNRASQTQKEYIKRSLLVSNLVKFLDDTSSK